MKKIYSLLLAAAMGSTFASAEQTVFIGSTGYDDLAAAVSAASNGDVITIKADQELSSRINLTDKSLTFKGENNPSLKRTSDNIIVLLNAANEDLSFSFEGLTFDCNNVGTKVAIEAKNGKTATIVNITDCKFINNTSTTIQTKYKTTLTNVSASGEVFVGANNCLTVAGTADYPMYVENTYAIAAGENLSGSIKLRLQEGKYTANRTIVNNCTDLSVFTLVDAPEGYELAVSDGKIILDFAKYVVENTSKGTKYKSLIEALTDMTEPEEGENVLVVLESIDVTDRIGTNTGILACTIKGANADVTLKKTFNNTMFVSNNKNLTFENIILDCNGYDNREYEVQANSGTLTLSNVKIINCNAKSSVFDVKEGSRTLVLDNCTAENSSAPLLVNLNGRLRLNGNTNFNILVANAGATIAALGELTNTAPIEISFADGIAPALGATIVSGTEQVDKFKLTNGQYLNSSDGNLILSDTEQTGIENVEAAAAVVDVYNMQGILVKKNVNRTEASYGLNPGVYVIGGKKTLVR